MLDRDMRYIAAAGAGWTTMAHRSIRRGPLPLYIFPDLPQRWKDVHKPVGGSTARADEDLFERADGSGNGFRGRSPWYINPKTIGGISSSAKTSPAQKQACISGMHRGPLSRGHRVLSRMHMDHDGRPLRVRKQAISRACSMSGDPEDLIGGILDFVHPD